MLHNITKNFQEFYLIYKCDTVCLCVHLSAAKVHTIHLEATKFGKTNGLGKEESVKGLRITYNS